MANLSEILSGLYGQPAPKQESPPGQAEAQAAESKESQGESSATGEPPGRGTGPAMPTRTARYVAEVADIPEILGADADQLTFESNAYSEGAERPGEATSRNVGALSTPTPAAPPTTFKTGEPSPTKPPAGRKPAGLDDVPPFHYADDDILPRSRWGKRKS